jgi:hypothetical protein
VRSRLAAEPKLANRRYKPPDSDALPQALQVVAHAKEVSRPDRTSVRRPPGQIQRPKRFILEQVL